MVGNFWEYKLSLTQLYVFPYCSTHRSLYKYIFLHHIQPISRHLYNQGRFVPLKIGTKIVISTLKPMNHENTSILEIMKDSFFTHPLEEKKNKLENDAKHSNKFIYSW